jgi:Flp pilus assembly protein TadG
MTPARLCRDILAFLHRAGRDTSGVTAMLFAICAVPVLLVVGAGVDFSRVSAARTAAQSAADAAALAAASSKLDAEAAMRLVADNHANANLRETNAAGSKITDFAYNATTREVTLKITGSVKPTFMALAGWQTLPYQAEAKAVRGLNGTTELVLVLDNTWSMAGDKLVALKAAAEDLVVQLRQDPNADVKIGVVPYADYVNVGVNNRNSGWVDVPADYSTTSARTCTTLTTRQTCTRGAARTCTRVVDGRSETYDCTPSTCTTQTVPPYESCSGGNTTWYRWYGCVGSRRAANLRLNDTTPSERYPGYLATSQNCLNPIVPLTSNQATVISAIRGMVVNIGGYRPSTYIPAGLIWGVNVLSPTAPFSEGAAYDPTNRRPRKVMVLMTDGENTLVFRSADGRHIAPSGNATAQAAQLKQTYDDMNDICTYAKSKQIEVFTVAFDITDTTAISAMRNCASSSAHYFDAKDRQGLADAFKAIALSLQNVRITQ